MTKKMMTKKQKNTQKQIAFYKLYKQHKKDPEIYLETWQFLGEIYIEELGKWEMMSYKCPTRLTDLYQENPGLLQRQRITGKSGSKYYQYRIAPNARPSIIRDTELQAFVYKIKGKTVPKKSVVTLDQFVSELQSV